MTKNIPVIARFLLKAKEDSGCWTWTSDINNYGYGVFFFEGKSRRAHKWAYEYFIGPIPLGFQLDHICKNRACVNPNHLEVVTGQENVLRSNGPAAINSRKTHCKSDHEFTPDNTYINKAGSRICRKCQSLHQTAYRIRKDRGL